MSNINSTLDKKILNTLSTKTISWEEQLTKVHGLAMGLHDRLTQCVPELLRLKAGRVLLPESVDPLIEAIHERPWINYGLKASEARTKVLLDFVIEHPVASAIIYCTFTPIPNPPRAMVIVGASTLAGYYATTF